MIKQVQKAIIKVLGNRQFAAGDIIRGSDRNYRLMPDGSFRRMNPKPYKGKAEMKRHKRQRREDREMAKG